MKKLVFFLFIVFLFISKSNAQDYSTGIGIRGGWGTGITLKHFLGDNNAVEGILDTRWDGFNITGLYEIHHQAFDVNRLNWYYGAGWNIGFWNGKNVPWTAINDNYVVIGINGILGLEYNFEAIPINLSVDWKPVLNISGASGIWGKGGAFSIRYIF